MSSTITISHLWQKIHLIISSTSFWLISSQCASYIALCLLVENAKCAEYNEDKGQALLVIYDHNKLFVFPHH